MVIAIIILLLEIIKQIICIKEGYSFWDIPLHFCSLFLELLAKICYYLTKIVLYCKYFIE